MFFYVWRLEKLQLNCPFGINKVVWTELNFSGAGLEVTGTETEQDIKTWKNILAETQNKSMNLEISQTWDLWINEEIYEPRLSAHVTVNVKGHHLYEQK